MKYLNAFYQINYFTDNPDVAYYKTKDVAYDKEMVATMKRQT